MAPEPPDDLFEGGAPLPCSCPFGRAAASAGSCLDAASARSGCAVGPPPCGPSCPEKGITGVGIAVGSAVGIGVDTGVGTAVGIGVDSGVGTAVGIGVDSVAGSAVGIGVDTGVGTAVGIGVGTAVGTAVGAAVGAAVITGPSCPDSCLPRFGIT